MYLERMHRVIANVGSNTNLDRIGREFNFEALIKTNPSQPEDVSPTLMAGTVEAIIGAVYLDGGIKSVSKVMRNLGLMPKLVRRTKLSKAKASSGVANTSYGAASHDMGAASP